MRMATVATVALCALVALPSLAAEESFDVSSYEKKAFDWTGYLELRPERQWLERESKIGRAHV